MKSPPNTTATEPGAMISGSGGSPLTVGDIRNAIANLDNDVEIGFGCTQAGRTLEFYRMKWRGENLLHFELSEQD